MPMAFPFKWRYVLVQAITPAWRQQMTKTIKTPASTKDSGRVKIGSAGGTF